VRWSRWRAWERWQAAAGPWRGWAVCHALTAPDLDGVTPRKAPPSPIADALARALSFREPTAVVLDLEPVLGVHVASLMDAHVVLILPRWPYADAVLAVAELLDVLISRSRRLHMAKASNVVFVVDAERSTAIRRKWGDTRADNRYQLSQTDLPNLESLRTHGINSVVKITNG
jgi:hypothetical protein